MHICSVTCVSYSNTCESKLRHGLTTQITIDSTTPLHCTTIAEMLSTILLIVIIKFVMQLLLAMQALQESINDEALWIPDPITLIRP